MCAQTENVRSMQVKTWEERWKEGGDDEQGSEKWECRKRQRVWTPRQEVLPEVALLTDLLWLYSFNSSP